MLAALSLDPIGFAYTEPEAFTLFDPQDTADAPRYFTTFRGHLWVHPTPDHASQLDHKFWRMPFPLAELNGVPEPLASAAFWLAMTYALRAQGRQGPARMCEAMYEVLADWLAVAYYPTMIDAREVTTFHR